jgi:putative endonuclease
MNCNHKFGELGELAVKLFYEKNNWKILEKNYFASKKYGEVDLIAKRQSAIAFIEVKSRKANLAKPIEMVPKSKQKKIIQTAELYLHSKGMLQSDFIIRFDIAIVDEKNDILIYENAFQKDN